MKSPPDAVLGILAIILRRVEDDTRMRAIRKTGVAKAKTSYAPATATSNSQVRIPMTLGIVRIDIDNMYSSVES